MAWGDVGTCWSKVEAWMQTWGHWHWKDMALGQQEGVGLEWGTLRGIER